jgi:hypothetical protein
LIVVSDSRDRTALAWLRDWPEAPTQKNLVGVVERLQFVRSLGIGSSLRPLRFELREKYAFLWLKETGFCP